MGINETLVFFQNLKTNTNEKSEIKLYDKYILILTNLKNRDLTETQILNIETEFVIDCSGFARLCIGKLYKSKWKSYSEFLKSNSAIAYFLPQENKLTYKSKHIHNQLQ